MKNRLFFTDPIKILYMMREFGVVFEHKAGVKIVELQLADLLCTNHILTAYVAKESEHIFKPKKGDDGHMKDCINGIPLRCCQKYNNVPTWDVADRISIARKTICSIDENFVNISFREGKHFFMCEKEESNSNKIK